MARGATPRKKWVKPRHDTAPVAAYVAAGAVRPQKATYTGEQLMTTTTSLAAIARRDLPDLSDRIIGPEDPGYDDARAVHNGMIDRHPALLVRCTSAEDVARCIAFARDQGAPIAVRSGGHNGAGLGVVDDGLVKELVGLAGVAVGG